MLRFDINIENTPEDWDVSYAIREVIANALDECALTDTRDIKITWGPTRFVIRDFGRGLTRRHLTQNGNAEKMSHPDVCIGKFGVGLKDALATFRRHGVGVRIRTWQNDFTILEAAKYGFDDINTLRAVERSPSNPSMVGTEVTLDGCTEADMDAAKSLFHKFSGERVLAETPHGQILERRGDAKIYVKGVKVADEPNFLFSYNITSTNAVIRKALNRERSNVGRTAYAARVKGMALAVSGGEVGNLLADDYLLRSEGRAHDELEYADVAAHACSILSARSNVLFVTDEQSDQNALAIDMAKRDGIAIVPVQGTVAGKIGGTTDVGGGAVRDIHQYERETASSFSFEFVDPSRLSPPEAEVYSMTDAIFGLIGGRPPNVREVLVSETMRPEMSGFEPVGLWDESESRIIVKRDQLGGLARYAGTLLHEAAHATGGHPDVSREFELDLTETLGSVAVGHRRMPGA